MSAIAAGIIGGVGVIGGALISGSASQNAANTESQAATAANQQQYTEWQQQQAQMAPYLASGTQNLAALNAAMPSLTSQFTMQDFQQNPGYQFQLSQGEQAMQRSAAASGMLNSTGTQQNLNNYAQGMANTDYQQALQNFTSNQQQRYNMMSGMAGMGLNAVGMNNQAGQNFANQTSSNLMGAANASAAGQIGSANAISSGLNSAGNTYMGYSMMNNLLNTQPQAPGYGSGAVFTGDDLNGSSQLTGAMPGDSFGPPTSGSMLGSLKDG